MGARGANPGNATAGHLTILKTRTLATTTTMTPARTMPIPTLAMTNNDDDATAGDVERRWR
eukprot:11154908-Lingulodinium_polyedra.AAC.1